MIDLTPLKNKLSEKPIAIFGLGKSGVATYNACKAAGIDTVLWDDNENNRNVIKDAMFEDLNTADFSKFEFLCLAPGIPLTHPTPHKVVLQAQKADCEIISDIEIFHRAYPNIRTIGVTGTNGKSTTVALIGHILKEAEVESVVGGNIGDACLSLPQLSDNGVYVFELSSYQIDLCPTYTPDIAVLTNISADHLDRHGGMEGYIAAKESMFNGEGFAVLCVDDKDALGIFKRLKPKLTREVIEVSYAYRDELDLSECESLQGKHNWHNAMLAYEVCRLLKIEHEVIMKALRSFSGLAHRQKLIAKNNGITYINDSKATNDQAASKALSTYKKIYWIAGGKSKDGGYTECEKYYYNVMHGFLVGEASEEIKQSLDQQNIKSTLCTTIDVAVKAATEMAIKNNLEEVTILLSPACASFDQFKSFEDRGDSFTQAVMNLEKKEIE